MLLELSVRDLGVIGSMTVRLRAGMIALTGETGAGKTLLVDAIELLMGGRADPGLVRPGAARATVDGRFSVDASVIERHDELHEWVEDSEIVISRVIPAEGRSRAYVNGRPATASTLAQLGRHLVDLHGQHAHQSLLGAKAQRDALDAFGLIDLGPLRAARASLAGIEAERAELGGDPRARHREIDLLRYQVDELDAAAITSATEDVELAAREDVLAHTVDFQQAGFAAVSAMSQDGGARDQLSTALQAIDGHAPFAAEASRLRDALAELDDIVDAVRAIGEDLEPDPEALAALSARRHLLQQLCRKYGDTLADVIEEHTRLAEQLEALQRAETRAGELDDAYAAAVAAVVDASAAVLAQRQAAAPALAAAIEAELAALDMAKATVAIDVSGAGSAPPMDGGVVEFRLAANPGSALQPLAKVASGGELARTMLALRSVLSAAPPILVFDEVDAGIGGTTGFAVGRALARLGRHHQVLVVTHLPQVAAFADIHLAVQKHQEEDSTVSEVRVLSDQERISELARMLSGQPDSETARRHGEELLVEAQRQRDDTDADEPAAP